VKVSVESSAVVDVLRWSLRVYSVLFERHVDSRSCRLFGVAVGPVWISAPEALETVLLPLRQWISAFRA
jgi:hypothetical protein